MISLPKLAFVLSSYSWWAVIMKTICCEDCSRSLQLAIVRQHYQYSLLIVAKHRLARIRLCASYHRWWPAHGCGSRTRLSHSCETTDVYWWVVQWRQHDQLLQMDSRWNILVSGWSNRGSPHSVDLHSVSCSNILLWLKACFCSYYVMINRV